jgi:hypothetical protein
MRSANGTAGGGCGTIGINVSSGIELVQTSQLYHWVSLPPTVVARQNVLPPFGSPVTGSYPQGGSAPEGADITFIDLTTQLVSMAVELAAETVKVPATSASY